MKTLVIGASTNSDRYSYRAVKKLKKYDFEVIPLGIREGDIEGNEIVHGHPILSDIHTVALYINPEKQKMYYDYILELKPKRVIFNPGTENAELVSRLEKKGVFCEENCVLVMLSYDLYNPK